MSRTCFKIWRNWVVTQKIIVKSRWRLRRGSEYCLHLYLNFSMIKTFCTLNINIINRSWAYRKTDKQNKPGEVVWTFTSGTQPSEPLAVWSGAGYAFPCRPPSAPECADEAAFLKSVSPCPWDFRPSHQHLPRRFWCWCLSDLPQRCWAHDGCRLAAPPPQGRWDTLTFQKS